MRVRTALKKRNGIVEAVLAENQTFTAEDIFQLAS